MDCQNYTLTRRYTDRSGSNRVLVFIKGGDFVHWHQEHPASWSSWWSDEEDRSLLRIPDNAWRCLKIEYEDEYSAKKVYA